MMRTLFITILLCLLSLGVYADWADDFEDGDVSDWAEETFPAGTDLNGSFAISTADVHGGTYSMAVTLTGVQSGFDYAPVYDTPITPGHTYDMSAWLKWTGDGSGLRVWGSWLDSGGAYDSSASGNSTYVGNSGIWEQRLWTTAAAPLTAAYLRLQIRVYGTTVPATGYVDDCAIVTNTVPVELDWMEVE